MSIANTSGRSLIAALLIFFADVGHAAVMTQTPVKAEAIKGASRVLATEEARLAELEDLKELHNQLMNKAKQAPAHRATLIFDLPVTYNRRVAFWLNYFQTNGRNWFREWLEKSTRYMPFIQKELRQAGLPADLAFMVMIESGFNPYARSPANAVGPWQFIAPTGKRYGLQQNWWLDERKDYRKATQAAIRYMKDLYQEFGSWYLVAASYNMGENGLRRRIRKAGTRDFWTLSKKEVLPQETVDYVPKILAVMLIAKAPSLYGFRDLAKMDVLDYEIVYMQGGTDMRHLADHLGITHKALKDLNAELVLGYIPLQVDKHAIRVPKGARQLVNDYVHAGKSASVIQPPTAN